MISSHQTLTVAPRTLALVSTTQPSEVHPKIASFVIELAPHYGVTTQELCAALHLSAEELESCPKHMSWNMYATLLNLYLSTTTHEAFIDLFWHNFTRQPINNHLMKIFRNVASPAKLYHIMDRYIGPRMLPCMVGHSYIDEQGLLVDEISLRHPEGALPCPIYFHLVTESLRLAPVMMMGLQPAVLIDFETDGLSARYTLKLPPSRSILRRMRDASKIFMGARSLFELLETHQQEQQQTYARLKSMNEELEARVTKRTRELAELNAQLARSRDAALRESEAKSTYLASMSHEIRTPLSVIIGYAELLEEETADQIDAQSAEDLHHITNSAKHLLALIGDILDLSKIEADKLSIVPADVPLHTLFDEIIQSIKPLAEGRHNVIKTNLDIPRGFLLRTDRLRLRQILMNLLSNAIKFTEHGKIMLDVELRDDAHLTIHVKDTGIGISEEQLTRIFHPFEQAQDTTTHTHGGTGLGMTISRQLAELMGGELHAVSKPGQGSTFTLTLPIIGLDS